MPGKKPSRPSNNRFSSSGAARGRRPAPGRSTDAARPGAGKPASPRPRRDHPANEHTVTANRKHGFAGGERPYDYAFYESEPATPEYMKRLFAKHSFAVTDGQLKKFWRYYELLREHNASLDLTRIMGIEATVLKHFIDSALVLQYFEPVGPVLDIGSGPGFPGVPLAVMRPDVKFILGESRGKRVGFLEKVISGLKLPNVTIFAKSVREDSPLGEENGTPVGDIITRALETVTPTLERVLPFISPGRSVAFMKGPGCDEEIAEASRMFAPAYKLTGDHQYVLPGTDQGRRLVVFTRL
jgi:16S rRNA (guanine527-N7)-methyltransferase